MKKLFARVLTLCLLCGCCALADDTMVWEGEMAEKAAQIAGEFKTFDEIAIKIWVPDVMPAVELTDEDKEEGYIGYFSTADQDAGIGVQYANVEGMSLEEYAAELANSDIKSEPATINGIACLTYEYEGNGICAFTTAAGYILEVSCGPLANEGFAGIAALVFASIQPE